MAFGMTAKRNIPMKIPMKALMKALMVRSPTKILMVKIATVTRIIIDATTTMTG